MIDITNISADAHQKTTVLLADNTAVAITLDFLPRTQRWVAGVSWGAFALKGVTLCVHPNLLRSFRRVVPFGISCVSSDGVDPFDINDFDSGRVVLSVLDNTGGETDIEKVEAGIYQGSI